MNWVLICLVFALVLAILQACLQWWGAPQRPVPHFGWLAFAFFIASLMVQGHGH